LTILAQISDLHIGVPNAAGGGRRDRVAALRRCVAAINALDPRPDLVLVTGDLVDDGVAEEYEHFRTLMAPLDAPYYVIPGNHDDRAALRAAFADHLYLPRDGAFLHYVIEGYPLRLIGLDSIIPGRARGELCGERLAWLDAQLDRVPERPTLLFLHHPPFLDGIRFWDVLNCRNADGLATVVRRHRQVVGLVAGHLHQSIRRLWNGVMASSVPAPAQALALATRQPESRAPLHPPFFHLHEWDAPTGLTSRLAFIDGFGAPAPTA
jgi:3',5'-cyclic AMP phosphodiesterase CpdA